MLEFIQKLFTVHLNGFMCICTEDVYNIMVYVLMM